jgi:uncharacterized protein (TIGR00369 family)
MTEARETPIDFAAMMPFAHRCGITIAKATRDAVEGELPWAPELCTAGGVMHGGVLMTLADTLGAACAFMNLPEGASTSTIESKTNFFRPLRGGRAHAVSRPLHVGRTVIVVQTDIRDDDGRHVAQVTQTQAVIPAR